MGMARQTLRPDRSISSEAGGNDRFAPHQLDVYLQNQLGCGSDALSCEYHEGVVVLRGCVSSFHQKQMAQELARKVNGVKIIINRLSVDPSILTRNASEVVAAGMPCCNV